MTWADRLCHGFAQTGCVAHSHCCQEQQPSPMPSPGFARVLRVHTGRTDHRFWFTWPGHEVKDPRRVLKTEILERVCCRSLQLLEQPEASTLENSKSKSPLPCVTEASRQAQRPAGTAMLQRTRSLHREIRAVCLVAKCNHLIKRATVQKPV